jgi:hypothetical protein
MATDKQARVVELRAQGLTQKAIAAALGINQQNVSKLLRRAERREPGSGYSTVVKRPILNTNRSASSAPMPNAVDAVVIERRRGSWERFKSPILERMASEYEALRGAILRLPRGNTIDETLATKWERAYGHSAHMRSVIEQARVVLGALPRDPENIPTECGCLPSDIRRSPCPGHMVRS